MGRSILSRLIPLTAKMSSNDDKAIIVAIQALLRVVAHELFIRCIHLAAASHVESAGMGAYAHAAKKTFFFLFFFYKVCDDCVY